MKRNTSKDLISIVIPAKDEADNIGILLQRLRTSLWKIKGYNFETIVVCDNCADNTAKIVRKYGIKPIIRKGNPGKSKALIEGFKKTKGSYLVMIDADLSHLPEDLSKMIDKLYSRKNIGLVVASRELGGSGDATLIRRFGGLSLNFLSNMFFNTKLTDAINGYKIFKREIFDNYNYTAEGYAIEIELVANCARSGYKSCEVASFEAKRAGGKAKSKIIRDGWLFLKEVLTEGVKYRYEKLSSFGGK